ncbi:hypothetical protein, partial [Escherichia coli]|uniref:hypothetical protein n=1 Tax=Escherichia coli TaxID=562 RepID=UPI001BC8B93C
MGSNSFPCRQAQHYFYEIANANYYHLKSIITMITQLFNFLSKSSGNEDICRPDAAPITAFPPSALSPQTASRTHQVVCEPNHAIREKKWL